MSEEIKLTLQDLGIPSVEPKEEQKTEIITPQSVGGIEGVESVQDISDIAPFEPKRNVNKEFEEKTLQTIDENIERVKGELMENVIQPLKDQVAVARLEAEADGIEIADPVIIDTGEPNTIIESDPADNIESFSIDESDLKELIGEDEEEETEEEQEVEVSPEEKQRRDEIFSKYQGQIREVIRPVSKQLDLKKFRISTHNIGVNKALERTSRIANTGQWPLMNTGRLITFSGLGGEEIVGLNPRQYANKLQHARATYSILYNHLIDPNKPKTMEAWLNSICAFDETYVHFAQYLATFRESNYITYNCQKCRDIDLRKVDINDMIVFPNDKVKAKFNKLMTNGEDSTPSMLESRLVQVSDEYAIALAAPSIWGVVFETSVLDQAFSQKYASVLGALAYIRDIYVINSDNESLVPVDINPDKDNLAKSVRRKVVAYYNIIKSLTPDQYSLINGEIVNINSALADEITFKIPSANCSYRFKNGEACNTILKEQEITPLEMLFTRHQLATIGNFSKE